MEQVTNIVIPWRDSGCEYRRQSFNYVYKHMERYNPVVADDGAQPFSRSGSKNAGARLCTDDVIMFVDADTFIPHSQIVAALSLAKQGFMVHPFTHYHAIGQRHTAKIVNGSERPNDLISDWNITWATGGAVAMPKDFFFSIGAYDEGFVDWGFEDAALLIEGKKRGVELKRINGNCYHLWHPRQPENDQIRANAERYRKLYLGEE